MPGGGAGPLPAIVFALVAKPASCSFCGIGFGTRWLSCSGKVEKLQDPGAGHFGAARDLLWAMSPPSYRSAPPAHPVEL